jgi:hypothetical protein
MWRANVEINILIWNEIIKIEKINQIETIEITNEKKKNDKNNDNDNDNNNDNDNWDDDDENVEKFHKLYIIMIFETLSTMSVMFARIIFRILNNACFQHNIWKKSTFISYTIFNKSISINDLEKSIYVMKQKTIRVICRIDNKWANNFFFRHLLRFEMLFKFNQFWLIKRDSLSHVVQIEFVHDRRSRHHNKKTS